MGGFSGLPKIIQNYDKMANETARSRKNPTENKLIELHREQAKRDKAG
jgi:hypothetical protein